jgi:hypothetical protein
MFRRMQLLVRSWNQDTPPDERFTEKYGDRVLVGQRRSNAFPDAYAQLATEQRSSSNKSADFTQNLRRRCQGVDRS